MDGEGARAVVRAGADKKILRAQIGDEIDGWKVSQIEGRKVVLSLDGRFATFKLFTMIAGDRSPPAGQLQPHRAKRKIRSDGFRRSKLHRRLLHRNLVSRENIDGAESKFGFKLVAQSISYTKN